MITPFGVNLYSQEFWHGEGGIIGTREGLWALRVLIDAAMERGHVGMQVFAGDGEGYELCVACVDEATMCRLPTGYTWEPARDSKWVHWLSDGKWEIGEDSDDENSEV